MTKKKLPIGIQTFAEMIIEGYYYIDKTPFAWRMINEGKYYFLSRPRRFGKSLFLDTLRALFEGQKELFKGLFIHDKWDWNIKYPVIHISFGAGLVQNRPELDRRIRDLLRVNQENLGIVCHDIDDVAGCLGELIRQTHNKFNQRVVILVDEYDKPILDNINSPDIALVMREGLKNLYSVIKDADAHIRFTFFTGVSKFSKVSLFSGINNLNDISMDTHYSSICGYTEMDVDTIFAPELDGLDREEIRRWYNGYSWLGDAVYNPFDLLLLFNKREFRPWWFETGTPTFLIKLLAQRNFFTPNLTKLRTGLELISTFDVDMILPEALLFQTGYLTIHKAEALVPGNWVYTLAYPNKEVESSLNKSLLSAYTGDMSQSSANRLRLLDLLLAEDIQGLKDLFSAFFAGIPHHWYDNNPIAQYEGFYASVFYSYFAALGLTLIAEDITHHGRIDMTVKMPMHIYLFEFKVVELIPEGRALAQLKTKNYAAKYLADGRTIYLVGVEFSRKERTVVGFEIEFIPSAVPGDMSGDGPH